MRKGLAVAFGVLSLVGIAGRIGLSFLFSANYLPHLFCCLLQPGLIWTNVAADGLIAAAYTSLFLCILWIARRLQGVAPLRPYLWVFLSFATFIMACGTTHFMDVVTVWWPFYPLSAALKVVCAAVSVATAALFLRTTPKIPGNVADFFGLFEDAQRAVAENQEYNTHRSQEDAERRRQEEALRKSEEFLERTGRLAGVGGWELDLSTNQVTWSPETCRILERPLPTGQLCGKRSICTRRSRRQ